MLIWWLPVCNETFNFDLSKIFKTMNIPFKVTGKGQIAEHILESIDNTPTNKKSSDSAYGANCIFQR